MKSTALLCRPPDKGGSERLLRAGGSPCTVLEPARLLIHAPLFAVPRSTGASGAGSSKGPDARRTEALVRISELPSPQVHAAEASRPLRGGLLLLQEAPRNRAGRRHS